MKVLVVGGDGRAHTLLWKIAQSPKVEKTYCTPGNVGTAQIAENLLIAPVDIGAQVKAAQEKKIDLVVVSPEAPLDSGIVDSFQEVGIPIFGPTRAATRIESSKVFARELMEKYGISCPSGRIASTYAGAKSHVIYDVTRRPPIVVKADGLAAGKGVVIAKTKEKALEAIYNFMVKRTLGDAGNQVIIDEYLTGREVSIIGFTDSKTVSLMVPACDYKKLSDGDQGPNTGGMGGYSPPKFMTPSLMEETKGKVLKRAIEAMEKEGRPYKGVLYAGLMLMLTGSKVLEFNARFGDPEAQVQLPLLKTDIVDILLAVINGTLDQVNIEWSDEACVGVVMASEGYPGKPITGRLITGLNDVDKDIMVFHAGTKIGERPGEILTSDGRVLTVVATGKTLTEARDKVYANVSRIHFEGCHYRKDIALL